MKNIKTIKKWLSPIVTVLLLVVLFAVIFVPLGIAEPSSTYYIELGIITSLLIIIKTTWYSTTEESRMEQSDIKEAKEKYDDKVEEVIKDTKDFEKFLLILDDENMNRYIKEHIGSRTPYSLGLCKYNKKLKKETKKAYKLISGNTEEDIKNRNELIETFMQGLTPESFGKDKYDKLLIKIKNKADKIPKLKAADIITRGESKKYYDSKNYQKEKKRKWQTISTIISVVASIGLTSIAFREIMLAWESVFRYLTYAFAIFETIVMTVITANKNTYNECMDHLSRMEFIVDMYKSYKTSNKLEVINGDK